MRSEVVMEETTRSQLFKWKTVCGTNRKRRWIRRVANQGLNLIHVNYVLIFSTGLMSLAFPFAIWIPRVSIFFKNKNNNTINTFYIPLMCMLHSTFLFNYKLITSSALVTYIFLLLLFIIYISLLYKLSYISFFLSYSCLHYITFPYEILILLLLDSFLIDAVIACH